MQEAGPTVQFLLNGLKSWTNPPPLISAQSEQQVLRKNPFPHKKSTLERPKVVFPLQGVPEKSFRYNFLNVHSLPNTAGNVYLADSAQVPRVHVQVHRGGSRSVLGRL